MPRGTRVDRFRRAETARRARAGAWVLAALVLGVAVAGCGIRTRALDVNAADATALATLPGLAPEDAQRIVANRPYMSKEDLLRRRVLTEAQYASVREHLYVGPPGTPDFLEWTAPTAVGP